MKRISVLSLKHYAIIILIIFSIAHLPALSQRLPGDVNPNIFNENPDTTSRNSYYFLAPVAKLAEMIHRGGFEVGISAGITLNNSFNIGAGYYYLFTHNIIIENPNLPFAHLRLDYGGIELGYNLKLNKFFGLSWQALFGLGKVNISQSVSVDVLNDQNGNWLFLSEPGQHFYFYISKKIIIDAGLNYRLVTGVDYFGVKSKNLCGPVISLAFKIIN